MPGRFIEAELHAHRGPDTDVGRTHGLFVSGAHVGGARICGCGSREDVRSISGVRRMNAQVSRVRIRGALRFASANHAVQRRLSGDLCLSHRARAFTVIEQVVQIVSAIEPDWSRERLAAGEWNAGKRLLASIREYQRWLGRSGKLAELRRAAMVLQHRFWSCVTGAEIPLDAQLAGGLLLPHPNGIVVHPRAIIGPNCLLFQQVTIGTRIGSAVPTIGGHVDIGAGAKILGAVRIGDHARIGANAVVLIDVPEGATAVGNPARILSCRAPRQASGRSITSATTIQR
jgi:serine O-acetyltransferase